MEKNGIIVFTNCMIVFSVVLFLLFIHILSISSVSLINRTDFLENQLLNNIQKNNITLVNQYEDYMKNLRPSLHSQKNHQNHLSIYVLNKIEIYIFYIKFKCILFYKELLIALGITIFLCINAGLVRYLSCFYQKNISIFAQKSAYLLCSFSLLLLVAYFTVVHELSESIFVFDLIISYSALAFSRATFVLPIWKLKTNVVA
ncbi:MAG: hypothetical protein ACI4V7_03040 [Succinivibrionaceae bacterium]